MNTEDADEHQSQQKSSQEEVKQDLSPQRGQTPAKAKGPVQETPVIEEEVKGELEESKPQIQNVWAHNWQDELAIISSLIETREYNIVSFDTEFPGFLH